MPERKQKPNIGSPSPNGTDSGPKTPSVKKPEVDDLLKKMRKIDPDQAQRYRQRTGE